MNKIQAILPCLPLSKFDFVESVSSTEGACLLHKDNKVETTPNLNNYLIRLFSNNSLKSLTICFSNAKSNYRSLYTMHLNKKIRSLFNVVDPINSFMNILMFSSRDFCTTLRDGILLSIRALDTYKVVSDTNNNTVKTVSLFINFRGGNNYGNKEKKSVQVH